MKNLLYKNFKSIVYTFKQAYNCDKTLLPLMVANMLIDSLVPFVGIVFPKYIIDELTIGKSVESALLFVFLFVISGLILNSLNTLIDTIVSCKKERLIQQHYRVFGDKTMSMDLQDIENPDISNHKTRAQKVITWNSRNIDGVKNAIGGMISFSIQIVGYIFVLSKLNILIVAIIIGVVIINAILNNFLNKANQKNDMDLTLINRIWNYLSNIVDDSSFGKLIRVYDLKDLIINKCKINREQYKEKQIKIYKFNSVISMFLSVLSLLQEGVIYIFLAVSATSGEISIGEFSMYLAATIGLTSAINNLVGFSIGLNYTSDYIKDFIDFVSLPDSMSKAGLGSVDNDELIFEFRNVSFKYPHTDKFVLNNINVKFKFNERISLVGENGAGKSTFIKLLMRFYDPTDGEVLLNGRNIKEYKYSEYLTIFSTVFQDFQLFCFTILENVALDKAQYIKNELDVRKAMDAAGILAKIESLPYKIHTYLGKNFEECGTELSGGEMQKLAIARAIYKDSNVFIMDEPASNLSPTSEYDILKRFSDSTQHKMVIYISHRLASSVFSDRILVFQNGRIIEDGTHYQLIKADGFYKKMYLMQSSYYKDGEGNEHNKINVDENK